MSDPSPLFVVIEPGGAHARGRPTLVAWASETDAGVARGRGLAKAAARIAEAAAAHPLFLADPLFDEPRLESLFADAGLGGPPPGRDWLLALAPFGQARNWAAILEAAEARSDPQNPAERLLEAWREAKARCGKTRQPRR
jgi:hypothetical protein